MDRNKQIDTFNGFSQVSRETIISLVKYENMLIRANNELNLIGKSTEKEIWHRHFLDSFQVIDFISKNEKTLIDLGSGAGFPGLIIGIAAQDRKIPNKIKLIEKSPKKVIFLNKIIDELNLKIEVIEKNVFQSSEKFIADVFVARAFKPLSKILELIHSNAKNWKKIIIFMGKTSDQEILHASKNWNIQYKQSVSVTSSDSKIIEIKSIEKK